MTPRPPDGAGYSGTPLHRKLGIRDGMRCAAIDAPADYGALLAGKPDGVEVGPLAGTEFDFIHIFVRERQGLVERLGELRGRIAPAGMIWVSWPKRASGVATDVTEDVVRGAALEVGLVDVKVCAVDATWSGLKLVIRLKDRPQKRQV